MLKEEEKKILNWISGSNPDFRRIMQKIQVLFKKEDYTKKQFNMTLANRLIRADKSEWLLEIAHKYPQHSFSFESSHETRMDPVHVFLGQEKLNLVDALAKRKVASEDEYWESRWAIIESLLEVFKRTPNPKLAREVLPGLEFISICNHLPIANIVAKDILKCNWGFIDNDVLSNIRDLINNVNLFEHFESVGLDWKGVLIDSAGPTPRIRSYWAIQSYFLKAISFEKLIPMYENILGEEEDKENAFKIILALNVLVSPRHPETISASYWLMTKLREYGLSSKMINSEENFIQVDGLKISLPDEVRTMNLDRENLCVPYTFEQNFEHKLPNEVKRTFELEVDLPEKLVTSNSNINTLKIPRF